MSAARREKFSCSFCGKQYVWKAELAGKPIACSCGQVFRAPDSPQGRWQDDVLAEVARRSVPPPKAEAVRAETIAAPAPTKAPNSVAMPPAPAVIPHIQPAQYREVPRREEIKRLVVIALGVALLITALITIPIMMHRNQKPATPALADDGQVNEWIETYGRSEARAWLAPNVRHDVVGAIWTREQAVSHINQWYEMGAKDVLAFGGMVVRKLVIELPSDSKKRQALFDMAEQFRQQHHRDDPEVKDVGQKFIIIDLD